MLWVVAIFAVIELTLGLVFFLYERAAIGRQFDRELEVCADSILPKLRGNPEAITDNELAGVCMENVRLGAFDELNVTLYRSNGGVIASTASKPPDLKDAQFEEADETYEPQFSGAILKPIKVIEGEEQQEFRVLTLQFVAVNGKQYVLLIAGYDDLPRRSLLILTQVLLIAAPIGIVAAAVSGWFIAGIAVSPLIDITRLAGRLGPESIGEQMHLASKSSEIRELEAELDEARLRLERGFRAQERFMSNVAHELKTPISVMLADAQTTNSKNASPAIQRFLRNVEDESRKLGRLIDSFLLLTRVREGKRSTVQRNCLVNDIIMDSVEECSTWASQQNVYLHPKLLSGETDLDTEIIGDPELLRTMLNNLVLNAVRFSPRGERVHILADQQNGRLSISVRDHGTGIPDHLLPRLFDRFTQAETEERRGRGHGIGLEIAQGIAELHGGTIVARNRPEGGCEFTISLPLEPAADSPQHESDSQ